MNSAPAHTEIAIPPDRGATLVVDIDAVVANYKQFRALAGPVPVAASLKADAYGLGVEKVAKALANAECRIFFVALPAEGIEIRRLLPQACIVVLSGPDKASAPLFIQHRLSPALNSLAQIALWQEICAIGADTEAAVLHVDTGMSRLGLDQGEIRQLSDTPALLEGVGLQCILSHLACADEPDNPMNARQREDFIAAANAIEPATGKVPRSLANSSGVYLGSGFHFDLVRPGAALYGINPTPHQANPMKPTVGLYARVIQVRDIGASQTVGYGATFRATGPSRIATIAIGYGDGYMRSVGNTGDKNGTRDGNTENEIEARAFVGNTAVPVVGRISMDLVTLDVSAVAPDAVRPGTIVELMGGHIGVDELAGWAGTIGYEILTSLTSRLHRTYIGGVL